MGAQSPQLPLKQLQSGVFHPGGDPSETWRCGAQEKGKAIPVSPLAATPQLPGAPAAPNDVKQQLLSRHIWGFGGFLFVFFRCCGIESDKSYSWQALEEQCGSIWERLLVQLQLQGCHTQHSQKAPNPVLSGVIPRIYSCLVLVADLGMALMF